MLFGGVQMCLEYLMKFHWCSFMPAGCGRDWGIVEGQIRESKYIEKSWGGDERDNGERFKKREKSFDIYW